MAAPMKEADSNARKCNDQALDVSSSAFDPLRALYSRRVQLPCPNIAPLNNIAEYESYSKGKTIRQRREETRREGAQQKNDACERAERQFHQKKYSTNESSSLATLTEEERKTDAVIEKDVGKRKLHRNRRNVITRMEGYTKGPLSFLQRCVSEKLLIQVWIRSAVDLRGMCKGYLVAFDKHFNLAMIDVDELYRCPKWKETQLQKENKREKRRVKQLKEKMAMMSITTTEVCSVTEKSEESQTKNEPSSKEVIPSPQESHKAGEDAFSKGQLGAGNEQNISDAQSKNCESETCKKTKVGEQDPNAAPTCAGEQVQASYSEQTSSSKIPPPPTPKSPCKFIERHVNQLFIRGDNVVSIMVLE